MSINSTQGKLSPLEELTKDMTWVEIDEVWHKMEDGIAYISAIAREPAFTMIKELKAIAQRKHEKELELDGG